RMGAEHAIAEDGDEALHWLEREAFDLALIDIEMPRMSGIEVIRTLRTMTLANRKMPVIAVTAYVMRANRDAIYAAGADAILPKPLPAIEVFGKAISDALCRTGSLRGEQAPPPPPEMNRATFDRLIAIAGPEATNELLDRLDLDLRQARTGLMSGIEAQDRNAIRAQTHVLIALAGAVGAERLQSLAQTLNEQAHLDQPFDHAAGDEALPLLETLIGFVAAERAARRARP
ncbi:MAG: response regulator, partial [Rhodobacteraceae bacterium]|nr:response regulator [Paracoccaceae bacterium]